MYSVQEVIKAKMATLATPGAASGRTMRQMSVAGGWRHRARRLPRASSGIVRKKACSIQTAKGAAKVTLTMTSADQACRPGEAAINMP